MPVTYKKIASVTVGSGGAANVEFTSIPATYTDLVLFHSLRGNSPTSDVKVNVYFNSSTSSYSRRAVYGDGSSAYSLSASTAAFGFQNISAETANTFSNCFNYIPNYAGSTNKSLSSDLVEETNGTTAYVLLDAGLWSNTAAITSIKLQPIDGSFLQHSSATLYGILKA